MRYLYILPPPSCFDEEDQDLFTVSDEERILSIPVETAVPPYPPDDYLEEDDPTLPYRYDEVTKRFYIIPQVEEGNR